MLLTPNYSRARCSVNRTTLISFGDDDYHFLEIASYQRFEAIFYEFRKPWSSTQLSSSDHTAGPDSKLK